MAGRDAPNDLAAARWPPLGKKKRAVSVRPAPDVLIRSSDSPDLPRTAGAAEVIFGSATTHAVAAIVA